MIDVSLEKDADPVPVLKLQADAWELNIWASLADLARLSGIRAADWDERMSLKAGLCAGAPVFWAIAEDEQVAILIGSDDETWDIALMVPLATVDEIVALAR
ncbi:hypothetical protein [Actinomadura craniellae]|nr:hypothetical protein [Actinomadura craniellae]